jgi:hypothetical protein
LVDVIFRSLGSNPYTILKNELQKLLDKSTRRIIVNLLNVPFSDRDEVIEDDAWNLINYLENSSYMSVSNVSPLRDSLAKDPSLTSIIFLLDKYQRRVFHAVKARYVPEEDRLEYYEISHPEIKKNTGGVCIICSKNVRIMTVLKLILQALRKNSDGSSYSIYAPTLEQYWNVVSSEPFCEQPVLGIGTGFLVLTGPDNKQVVYTAGHVVSAMDNKDNYNVIFGFYTSSNEQFEYTIPATNIFAGTDYYNIILHSPVKDILKHIKNDTEDYAILQLNQEVTGWSPLKLSSQPVTKSDTVYMIGHPSGLPMKVTSGAKVFNIQPNKFSTLLTTYKGNSGSPIFHSDRHEVVGILISGEEDWEKGTLYISHF